MRRLRCAALVLLCANIAAAAPVLHEPVAVPKLRCQDGVCRRDPDGEGLPEALALGEGLVRPPSPGAGAPVYSPDPGSAAPGLPAFGASVPTPGDDPPPRRRLRVFPDRSTGGEPPGERLYHEVFNPAVFPFKRMTVLDAVQADETLTLRDPALRPLFPVGAHLTGGRDPFYGAVVIDLDPARPVPLPSPAAGVRLLSFAVSPPAPLRFFLDGGDSLYVSGPAGPRRRLVFLIDAAQRYFAGPLLPSWAARPRLRDVPQALRSPLPKPVQRRAERVLRHLDLVARPDSDYLQLLDRLVSYFRAFDVGPLTGRRGSTYLDIAFEQKGACRHRSYAFVITALGAGVPARYVENELHVFVEVYVPVPGRGGDGYWRRVHLGGAPLAQRVLEAEDKVAYRSRGDDPFPQPPAFTRIQRQRVPGLPSAQGGGDGRGAGGRGAGTGAAGGAATSLGPLGPGGLKADPSGPVRPGRERPGPGEAGGAASEPDGPKGPGERPGPVASPSESATTGSSASTGSAEAPATAEGPGPLSDDDPQTPSDARPDPPGRPLAPTSVTVTTARGVPRSVYRGAPLRVSGRVQARGATAGGLSVHLFLDTPSGLLPLGQALTESGGAFEADVDVPRDAPLGDHRLIARVKGDQQRRGSRSR